jgi:hypothetical protein
LTTVDSEQWIGHKVYIVTGKHTGHIATLKSIANGWITIETQFYGETAKRASDLELYLENEEDTKLAEKLQSAHYNQSSYDGASTNSRPKRPRSNSESSNTTSNTTSNGQSRATRVPVAKAPPLELSAVEEEALYNPKRPRYPVYIPSNMSNRPTVLPAVASEEYPIYHYSTSNGIPSSDFVYHRISSSLPLKSFSEVQSKKSPLLEQTRSPFSAKNLSYYKREVNTALATLASLASHIHNQNQPFRMNDVCYNQATNGHLCDLCHLEKWPNSSICWNEFCLKSPYYFKIKTAEFVHQISDTSTGSYDEDDIAEIALEGIAKDLMLPPPAIPITPDSVPASHPTHRAARAIVSPRTEIYHKVKYLYPYISSSNHSLRDRSESIGEAATDSEDRSPAHGPMLMISGNMN